MKIEGNHVNLSPRLNNTRAVPFDPINGIVNLGYDAVEKHYQLEILDTANPEFRMLITFDETELSNAKNKGLNKLSNGSG